MFGNKNSKGHLPGMLGATTMMISMMPMEAVIEKLEESLQKYKVISNEETKKELQMDLMVLTIKLDSEGKNPMDLLKEATEMEAKKEMMDKLSGNKDFNQN